MKCLKKVIKAPSRSILLDTLLSRFFSQNYGGVGVQVGEESNLFRLMEQIVILIPANGTSRDLNKISKSLILLIVIRSAAK